MKRETIKSYFERGESDLKKNTGHEGKQSEKCD